MRVALALFLTAVLTGCGRLPGSIDIPRSTDSGEASGSNPEFAGALPEGVAVAALQPEPTLPVPAGWPFPDLFSRTAGTGRMVGGAFEWTDWVYDAYGALLVDGVSAPLNPVTLSASTLGPAHGSYAYAAEAAFKNGSDIFRAAVGFDGAFSFWRVDWNTLVDPAIPIALWTFDIDDEVGTGASEWPANANVQSPGIELALLVSAAGAKLIDAASGDVVASFPTQVDSAARSFVVRIPVAALPVSGNWKLRLGSGLANADGSGFEVPALLANGINAPVNAARLYNIAFRTAEQEPAQYRDGTLGALGMALHDALAQIPSAGVWSQELVNTITANFWNENHQAAALASGDVSEFSQTISWQDLRERHETSPPLLKGWSTRWIVNDLNLGEGVTDLYAGRVQPYAIYVPQGYDPAHAAPLTWMIHSAQSQYNQYAALNPRLTQKVCEDRGAICITPNGYGGLTSVKYVEKEFWQIWRQVAKDFAVDAARTIVTGYSAGGVFSYRMPHTYPSVFAAAMPLAGGFEQGCSSFGPEFGIGNFFPTAAADRAANVYWVPQVVASSFSDELSQYPGILVQQQRYENAGDRYAIFSMTSPEHIVTAIADGFATIADALPVDARVKVAPRTINYTWCPAAIDEALGLGPTSVYWISGLGQRDASGVDTLSNVVAKSRAIADVAVTPEARTELVISTDTPPMLLRRQEWLAGEPEPVENVLELALTNVSTLTLDAAGAGFREGVINIQTDGTTALTVVHLPPRVRIVANGTVLSADSGGRVVIELDEETTDVNIGGR